MSRLQHIDTDRERLPSGMRRVAYDADSQKYTFKDRDGTLWEGQEGAQYGRLERKPTSPQRLFSDRHNDYLPPYQEQVGCKRTSPNVPCSCYFCQASIKPRRRSSILQNVVKDIKRNVSVKATSAAAAAQNAKMRASMNSVTSRGSRRGTV